MVDVLPPAAAVALPSAARLAHAAKRGLDIIIAAATLIALAIPLAVIALLVRLTSPGPALYRQRRIGRDGRPFTILKFRSMPTDAEQGTGPVWATPDDPRATPLGRILRRTNLDELPQLWNVLRGDMSLVGPRPERPHFVARFSQRMPHYALRHRATPGITGWAQVHGWRGDTSIERRIAHDLDYIERWSLALDLKILWLTVRALLPQAASDGGAAVAPRASCAYCRPRISERSLNRFARRRMWQARGGAVGRGARPRPQPAMRA